MILKTIQIIALLQGLFLVFILLKNRKNYKEISFWLFFGSIASILLYIIGDDDNNLFKENADWFLFDSSLFITFLFLFFRNINSDKDKFELSNLLFFIPNFIYFIIEGLEILIIKDNAVIEIFELIVEFIFLGYLIYIINDIFKGKKKHWIVYIIFPIALLMSVSYINELLNLFGFNPILITNDRDFATYSLLLVAFLFYTITFVLIIKPKNFLPNSKILKYKTSNLNPSLIEAYKTEIINAMEVEQLYLNSKLNIELVSKTLNIPRTHISEILNIHINKSFQDFVNEYRIEAFIKSLQEDTSSNYTLFGLASKVGFNSKSSFNATFKKIKGVTPTQYISELNL